MKNNQTLFRRHPGTRAINAIFFPGWIKKISGLTVFFFIMIGLGIAGLPLAGQVSDIRGIGGSQTNFSGAVGSGARALGMGGAFIAVADDATAVSWNPAGLAQLEKPELSIVFRYQTYRNIIPAQVSGIDEFSGPLDYKGSSHSFDFASFTYPLRFGNFKIVPQISYQRSICFDVVNNEKNNRVVSAIDTGGEFRQMITQRTHLQKFVGGFDTVSFSVATTLFKRFHLGVSANLWFNGYTGTELETEDWSVMGTTPGSATQVGHYSSSAKHDFSIKGANMNAGLLINVLKNFKIGFVYKSHFSATLDYSLDMSIEGDNIAPVPTGVIVLPGHAQLEWPETWGFGLAFMPTDQLTFSADFTRTTWSKSILNDFENPDHVYDPNAPETVDFYFPTLFMMGNPFNLKQIDSQQMRLGCEYVFFSRGTIIPLRLGIFTDTQYFPDATGDKVLFFGITAGIGVKKGAISIDTAVHYEFGDYVESPMHYTATRFSELRAYISTIYSF